MDDKTQPVPVANEDGVGTTDTQPLGDDGEI
jgi:hypothetical protein